MGIGHGAAAVLRECPSPKACGLSHPGGGRFTGRHHVDTHSYCNASSGFSLAALRAGQIAAKMPTMTDTTANTIS